MVASTFGAVAFGYLAAVGFWQHVGYGVTGFSRGIRHACRGNYRDAIQSAAGGLLAPPLVAVTSVGIGALEAIAAGKDLLAMASSCWAADRLSRPVEDEKTAANGQPATAGVS